MKLQQIPVIEFEEIVTGQFQTSQFINILKKFGNIHIVNITDPAFTAGSVRLKSFSQQLFKLSEKEKKMFYIGNSVGHRGYVPVTEKGQYTDEMTRVYEAFDIGPEGGVTGWFLCGENRYPEQLSGAGNVIREYFDFILSLGRIIASTLVSYYSHHDINIDDATSNPASQLRLLHYLPHEPEEIQQASSMGAHTDYELFTLLLQDSPGLLSRPHKDAHWQNIPAIKNSLLLIAGDVLEILSGGEITSLIHRVQVNGNERYSFPFFMNFNPNTRLKRAGESDFNIGEHLISQLTRDFPYLRKKIDAKYTSVFEEK